MPDAPSPVPDLPRAAARPPRPAGTKRRISLPREGRYWVLATIGLWLTGWFKGINLILLLGYLLLALLVLNWFAARRSLRGVAARRSVRGPIFAGAPFWWEVDAGAEGPR